jgi:SAM-dependent methyltransferase
MSNATIPAPPAELIERIGGGLEIGQGHLAQLKQLGRLRPDESVLDVGSGVGRTAIALTSYLSPAGSYEGFDIDRRSIEWCRQEITSRYPNFRFSYVDAFNSQPMAGNPYGRLQPQDVTFPYPDARFDLAFAYSVFTHMLAPGMRRYCAELRRVTRSGGRVLVTCFLLNDESIQALTRLESRLARRLLGQQGPCRTGFVVPEALVAYEEHVVVDALARNGLDIETVTYGTWMESEHGPSTGLQDTILAVCS